MSTKHDTVQKYCPDTVRASNLALDQWLQSHAHMNLRTYKALKVGFISVSIIILAFYAIANGASPGPTFWVAVAGLAVLNGIEVSELLATYAELQNPSQNDSTEDGRDE
ncbi:hypothetical protein U3A55_11820 [Salarchaeum sp. III]|uniref:hypothetical protein n=1 Tax=Salarchaeum sp. III TaxID=3107927 RepID=UPI002ED88C47